VFAAAAGLVLGVIGFLSGDLLICLFDWTCMVVFGSAILALGGPPLIRLGGKLGLPAAVSIAISVVLTAVPISAFAAGFGHLAWPKQAAELSVSDWYFKTLAVEGLVVGLWALSEAVMRASRPAPAAPSEPVSPRANGSDGIHGGPAYCLQMQDHYVRVHRASGATLELMSLKEAIAKYGSPDGLQVHRSWWVSRAAIGAVEKNGRGFRLRVNGSLVVPIARNRIAELKALNLI
jgi:hypothetical protein